MTIETRTTIELRDIGEIEIECIGCHTKVTWQPSLDENFIPTTCKKCDEKVFIEGSLEHKDLLKLISILTQHSFGTPGGPYVLRFAIKDDLTNAKQ